MKVVEGRANSHTKKRRAQGISHDDVKMLPGLQEENNLSLHPWLNLLTCLIINTLAYYRPGLIFYTGSSLKDSTCAGGSEDERRSKLAKI